MSKELIAKEEELRVLQAKIDKWYTGSDLENADNLKKEISVLKENEKQKKKE